MFDMSAMLHAKKKASENQEKKAGDYEKFLNEGFTLYELYAIDQKEVTLKNAALKFYDALACKRSNMEPYMFLSMIFFLFDEEEIAKEYFKTACELAGARPGFSELKENIGKLIYNIAA